MPDRRVTTTATDIATLRAEITLLTTRHDELRAWLHERLDESLLTREADVFEEVLDWLENHP